MDDKVIITGTGLVTSLGLNATETWNALLSGKSGIKQIEEFDTSGFECRAAAQVQGLGPEELNVHPRDSRIMDKHSYMLLKATRHAFKDSKLDNGLIPPEDIGYYCAMGMVDYNIDDLLPSVLKSLDEQRGLDYNRFFSSAYQEIHPLWPLSMLNNISFCQIAIDLGIKGENTVFSPHSDSCIHAIIEAYNIIIEKKAKVALAGGVSEKISPLSLARASLFGILNNNPPSPPFSKGGDQVSPPLEKVGTTRSRGDVGGFSEQIMCSPFGKDRKGTILGEGCGIMALELLSSAEERQMPCLAIIAGYGCSFEKDKGFNCPTSKAISLAMEAAISRAKLDPSDIDLIIAHGDGTVTGDNNEIEAIHNTFAKCINKLNVFSSKSALGHLLSGAPAVDTILGIYILKNGIIPAVFNSVDLDNSIKFNVVRSQPLKVNPKRIIINSRSYEGQCASLIIEMVE